MSGKQQVRFYGTPGEVKTLEVVTDGCVVEIKLGLRDDEGSRVTRVDVAPEGESRGGDAQGRVWDVVPGEPGVSRVVRRADAVRDADEAEAEPGDDGRGYWSLVTTGPLTDGAREHIANLIMGQQDCGLYEYLIEDDDGDDGDE